MALSRRRRARAALARAARWIVAASAGIASLAALPGRAEADDDAIYAMMGVSVAAADILFYSYTVAMMVKDQHPSAGWSLAQVIVTAPQTVAFTGVMVNGELKESEEAIPAFMAALLVGSLTAHGVFSLASDEVSPSELFVLSPIIAANSIFTTAALGRLLTREHLASLPLAITELAVAGPPTVYLGYRIGASRDKAPWIGLMAWSGAIVVHGAASLLGRGVFESDGGSNGALRRSPFSIRSFGPTAVSDGVRTAPGFQIMGTF